MVDGAVRLEPNRRIDVDLAVEEGRPVILGVRPDDLYPGGADPLVEGKVTVREPLGPETLVYVGTEQGEVIAKADGRKPPEVGEHVKLSASSDSIHVFDAKTGKALT